ncbi:hypothetical protein PROFUN_01337 [Planoprotostelium fungivorum]|uniref:Uncharacterized protein n=1 Tax=Planoprotostelium fungivorum TaxID=1890364 RepID=A0A2P6NZV2_9EUKA|nr:hypothetical protein PROFUN_01337 [Planoprotostelium fungivorum]
MNITQLLNSTSDNIISISSDAVHWRFPTTSAHSSSPSSREHSDNEQFEEASTLIIPHFNTKKEHASCPGRERKSSHCFGSSYLPSGTGLLSTEEVADWRWVKTSGIRKLKDGRTREHFSCALKNELHCSAKYTVTYPEGCDPKNSRGEVNLSDAQHNHTKPKVLRPSKEVWENAKKMVSTGGLPSVVSAQLQSQFCRVPSVRSIQQLKYRTTRKDGVLRFCKFFEK